MAITDMTLITNKAESLKTADFTKFKDALISAKARPTPIANKNIDDAVDQMIARWKNSTKKTISKAEWTDLTELCRKVYYEREEKKATISRGIWQVLKDNIL